MPSAAPRRLEDLITLSTLLTNEVIEQGATSPWRIGAVLEQLAPDLTTDERRSVLRLANWMGAYVADALDTAMLTAMEAAQWTHAIAAFALQERWTSFEFGVCLGDHPDDPDKSILQANEIEYLRPALTGIHLTLFGRVFREQLAQSAEPSPIN